MPASAAPRPGSTTQVVYIVDDDREHLRSLEKLLTSVSHTVETFETADALLQRLPPDPAGCAVLDVRLPGMSGMELHEEMIRRGIPLPVIIMTAHGDVPMVVTAFQHGVVDFVQKPYSPQGLIERVGAALRKDADERVAREARSLVMERIQLLTKREHEVFTRLIDGLSNKEIAADLGVGQTTIDFHRTNMLQKMQVESVSDLIREVVAAVGKNADADE